MAERRTSELRRTGDDRRKRQRGATNLVTVVEISGSDLRVALLRKLPDDEPDRVEATTVAWRKEAALLNSEVGLSELSAAPRRLGGKTQLARLGIPLRAGRRTLRDQSDLRPNRLGP